VRYRCGTGEVRYRCDTGAIQVRYRCGTGAIQVPYRCDTGAIQVRYRCGTGAVQVRYRCGTGAHFSLGEISAHFAIRTKPHLIVLSIIYYYFIKTHSLHPSASTTRSNNVPILLVASKNRIPLDGRIEAVIRSHCPQLINDRELRPPLRDLSDGRPRLYVSTSRGHP
jgi:hypothetical protein